jgi:very-short-patch-repair endonuclease
MADLHLLGAETSWVWTRAEALAVLPAGQVRALLRDGYWRVLLPGVYTDAGCEPTAEQRAHAVVLASGGHTGQPVEKKDRAKWRAVAMGRTAARVWDFPLIDDDDPATGSRDHLHEDVAVRTGRRDLVVRRHGGPPRHVHRHRPQLAPLDVVRRKSSLLLTSKPRTLFDCASIVSHEALVCMLDHALHTNSVTLAQLSSYAQEHRWQPGAPAFRTALAAADERAESPHETLVRLLLLPALPSLTPQVRIRHGGRVLARVDLGDEQVRFAVEADGRAGHSGQAMLAKDRRRDRTTAQHGWHTERITWFEVRCEQAATVTRVVTEHEQHSRRRRSRTA